MLVIFEDEDTEWFWFTCSQPSQSSLMVWSSVRVEMRDLKHKICKEINIYEMIFKFSLLYLDLISFTIILFFLCLCYLLHHIENLYSPKLRFQTTSQIIQLKFKDELTFSIISDLFFSNFFCCELPKSTKLLLFNQFIFTEYWNADRNCYHY
jgi:hypothetical protein